MTLQQQRDRALDRLRDLAIGGLDIEQFWRHATVELERTVAFDWRPCWFTLDPDSLVITSHFNEEIDELDPEVFQNEYEEEDVNKLAEVALLDQPVATLSRATNGDRARSRRYRDLLSSYGMGQELVATMHAGGSCWAGVTLYRAEGQDDFDEGDIRFLSLAAPVLAEGARRGLLMGEALDDAEEPVVGSDPPAVLILDQDLGIVSATAAGETWLHRLGSSEGQLPDVVRAVGSAALSRSPGSDANLPFARRRTRDGAWVFVHGSRLQRGEGAAAVIIERASPDRLGPLLMSAYGLTQREQEVTHRVLAGQSTAEIAAGLFLSAWTVQDHLKSIFDKVGVRSRRELLATVFFDQFEPRARRNEQQVLAGRPIRGGPLPRRSA